jgi:hypothetical protein
MGKGKERGRGRGEGEGRKRGRGGGNRGGKRGVREVERKRRGGSCGLHFFKGTVCKLRF